RKLGVPAKAGTHWSAFETVERWIPAFAGTPILCLEVCTTQQATAPSPRPSPRRRGERDRRCRCEPSRRLRGEGVRGEAEDGRGADRPAAGRLLRRGGLRLRHRWAVGADLGVPRAGEAAAADLVTREDVIVGRPFGARHLVEHLDAVAVGIAQVDAERDPVIRDMLDRLSLRLDALVELLQIIKAFEAPGHVVEADLAL